MIHISKYIWAFDLSMDNSGVSIFDLNGNLVFICSISTNKKQSHGKRLKIIADKLLELKKTYEPLVIVLERGFSRFNTSTQVIYRVHGLVNYIFSECEQIYYPPKKVKSTILNGNATKKQIQDKIMKMYPNIKFEDDDQSDAFAVGLTYMFENKLIK